MDEMVLNDRIVGRRGISLGQIGNLTTWDWTKWVLDEMGKHHVVHVSFGRSNKHDMLWVVIFKVLNWVSIQIKIIAIKDLMGKCVGSKIQKCRDVFTVGPPAVKLRHQF